MTQRYIAHRSFLLIRGFSQAFVGNALPGDGKASLHQVPGSQEETASVAVLNEGRTGLKFPVFIP